MIDLSGIKLEGNNMEIMDDKNKIVIDTYGKVAKQYDSAFGDDYSDTQFINTFLDSLCGKEILDIGCGVGNLTNYMYEKGFHVEGIDLSEEMLKIANMKYKNISFKKMDMRNIDMNKKYDGISLLYSLFHLTKTEVKSVLPKYHSLLKERGKMLLILQEGDGEKIVKEPLNQDLFMFVNYYHLEEMKQVLEVCHFKILDTAYKPAPADSLSKTKLVILCEKE